jgi:hypothetical protein
VPLTVQVPVVWPEVVHVQLASGIEDLVTDDHHTLLNVLAAAAAAMELGGTASEPYKCLEIRHARTYDVH